MGVGGSTGGTQGQVVTTKVSPARMKKDLGEIKEFIRNGILSGPLNLKGDFEVEMAIPIPKSLSPDRVDKIIKSAIKTQNHVAVNITRSYCYGNNEDSSIIIECGWALPLPTEHPQNIATILYGARQASAIKAYLSTAFKIEKRSK